MGLRAYIVKRVIFSLILVLFVITINFIIFELMPGNPVDNLASAARLRKDQIEEVLKLYGFDQAMHIRFLNYARNMLTWQFGYSFYRGSIASEISIRLPNTLLLTGGSIILSMVIGIVLGVIAAHKRGGLFDSGSVFVSLTTYALPSFWMGMVALLIFCRTLHWFPGSGPYPYEWGITGNWPQPYVLSFFGTLIYLPSLTEIGGRLWHVTLPIAVLTVFNYGGWLLLTRATMLETLTEDYIVTARAKGLKERTVLFKHALKNASLPLITSAALSFGFLLTGAIITEQVFSYPGLGHWIWEAIAKQDYPAMQAIFFVIALCVIIANFTADILYGVVDPRITYG